MVRLPAPVRRALVRMARAAPVKAGLGSVYAAQFGALGRFTAFDSASYWLAAHQPMAPDERVRSVAMTERLFMELVEGLRPRLMIEAGAKDASVSARVKAMLPGTRVVAFEANPYTYRRFRRRHATNTTGVEYLQMALGARPGDVTFQVRRRSDGKPRADGQSSLLERVDEENGHLGVTVTATTLDDFFADHPPHETALWIDVEGAAHLVLEGATSLLADVQFLIVEVEERAYWQDQVVRRQLVARLRSLGFVPIARDFQSRYQFNVVWVASHLRDAAAVKAALADVARHAATVRTRTRH